MDIQSFVMGPVATNTYLLSEGEEAIVIDPASKAQKMIEKIGDRRLLAVLLTHGHFDHIGAAEKIRKDLGVPVYAGALEQTVLDDPLINLSGKYTWKPFTLKADRLLSDGEEFSLAGCRIRVLHTPGHSEGGVCYELPDEGILFSGDTLFESSYGRTDGPDGDPEAMLRSLARLFKELPGEMNVLPGHGDATTIAEERTYNPALRELRERAYI